MFSPNLHPHIDFSKVTFLEQEVYLDYINGRKKEIDVLAEVKLNYQDKILHIHTEAQSTHEADFPERMFLYFSLSSSKRQKLGDFTSRPTIKKTWRLASQQAQTELKSHLCPAGESQLRLLPSSCFLYLSCSAPIFTFLNGHFPLFSPLRQTPQTDTTHRCFEYNREKDEPTQFKIDTPTQEVLQFNFLQLHLIKKNWKEYMESDNPAAAALLSQMGYEEHERVQVKLEFLRMIYPDEN